MSFLYSITIYPLQVLYQYVYDFCVLLTSSYGWGLICLSVISTIIFIPMKDLAQRIQDKERKIQDILKPQIQAIKSESTGTIRHERINGLYKRYAYHPIFSIRSAFGILLQVPFLVAAYAMLSAYAPITGHSFGLIQDLSRPDGLLGGFNLLPVIMTLFNLGALYTSAGFSRGEHIQGLLLAAFFLLLLYSAQSALLIYWTSNNAIFFFQSLFQRLHLTLPFKMFPKKRKQKPPSIAVQDGQAVTAVVGPADTKARALFLIVLGSALAGAFLLFPVLLTMLRDDWLNSVLARQGRHDSLSLLPDFLLLLYLFLVSGLVLMILFKKGIGLKGLLARSVVLAAMLGAVAYFAYADILADAGDFSFQGIYYYMFVYLTLMVGGLFLVSGQGRSEPMDLFQGHDRRIYFSSTLVLGSLLLVFGPLALYSSSPDLFSETFSVILGKLLLYFFWCIFSLALIWLLSPKKLTPFLALGLCVLSVWCLLNGLAFTRDFGPMEGFIFVASDAFGYKWSNLAMDMGVLTLVTMVIWGQYRLKLAKALAMAFNVIALALLVFCLFIWSADRTRLLQLAAEAERPLDGRLFSFSPDQPNCLIVILDSFDGDHLRNMLERDPNLAGRFDGFVVYSDTVAAGSCTHLSAPSIYGGLAYIPRAQNARPELSRDEKTKEALTLMPQAFADRGYDVALLGRPFKVGYDQILPALQRPEALAYAGVLPVSYVDRWKEEIGIKDIRIRDGSEVESSLILSLFRSAPNLVKEPIYKLGATLNSKSFLPSASFWRVINESALLGRMSELARADSPRPTLKILYSNLTHASWFLPPDSLTPASEIAPYPEDGLPNFSDNDERLQYYTERHALRFIAELNDWLKSTGVDEKTQIILVSDHNAVNWGEVKKDFSQVFRERNQSARLDDGSGRNSFNIIRPGAILLVKEPGARGALTWSEALMNTADVPAIACGPLGGCPGVEPIDGGPDRVRFHAAGDWNPDAHPANTFNIKEYTIRGPMRDIDSWTW